jgi:hypothetical protein
LRDVKRNSGEILSVRPANIRPDGYENRASRVFVDIIPSWSTPRYVRHRTTHGSLQYSTVHEPLSGEAREKLFAVRTKNKGLGIGMLQTCIQGQGSTEPDQARWLRRSPHEGMCRERAAVVTIDRATGRSRTDPREVSVLGAVLVEARLLDDGPSRRPGIWSRTLEIEGRRRDAIFPFGTTVIGPAPTSTSTARPEVAHLGNIGHLRRHRAGEPDREGEASRSSSAAAAAAAGAPGAARASRRYGDSAIAAGLSDLTGAACTAASCGCCRERRAPDRHDRLIAKQGNTRSSPKPWAATRAAAAAAAASSSAPDTVTARIAAAPAPAPLRDRRGGTTYSGGRRPTSRAQSAESASASNWNGIG